MSDALNPNEAPLAEDAPAAMTVRRRLTEIFFSPGAVFASLRRQPDFLAPMLALAALTAGFSLFFTFWVKADPREIARRGVERQLELQGKRWSDLSDAEQRQFEQGIEFSAGFQRFAPILGVVFGVVFTLALAGLYYVGMLLMRGQTGFRQVLAVTAHALYATEGVKYFLNIVVVFLRPPDIEQILRARGSFVISNPAPLLPESLPAWVLAAVSWVDAFSIWFMALMAIGLAAVAYKKTPRETAVVPVSLWLLGVFGSALFALVTGAK